jgi:hypothetical protein
MGSSEVCDAHRTCRWAVAIPTDCMRAATAFHALAVSLRFSFPFVLFRPPLVAARARAPVKLGDTRTCFAACCLCLPACCVNFPAANNSGSVTHKAKLHASLSP